MNFIDHDPVYWWFSLYLSDLWMLIKRMDEFVACILVEGTKLQSEKRSNSAYFEWICLYMFFHNYFRACVGT